MKIGEKITKLRKNANITQEELADLLNVSRQSISRWELEISFPETDKLIKLSKILNCSIDYLLNDNYQIENQSFNLNNGCISIDDIYNFIKECGHFFLATINNNLPSIRPFGLILKENNHLYVATDSSKDVFDEICKDNNVQIVSYNASNHRWIRINGKLILETLSFVRKKLIENYPFIVQKYSESNIDKLSIFRIEIKDISIH